MKPVLREGLKLAGLKLSDLDEAVRDARRTTHLIYGATGIAERLLAKAAADAPEGRVRDWVLRAAKATAKAHKAAETMLSTRIPTGPKS